MPACQDDRHARTAGVRKAPRHEIAGCGAPTVQRVLWGFGVGVSVGEVEPTLAIGSLYLEAWACVLARTSGSHVARQDLWCDHGPVLLIGASGCAARREPAKMARFGALLDQRCQHHEVSILIMAGACVGRCFGSLPRAKVSMMNMRPPQQGHGRGSMRGSSAAGASEASCCSERTGTASSSRARAMLAARVPLASSP